MPSQQPARDGGCFQGARHLLLGCLDVWRQCSKEASFRRLRPQAVRRGFEDAFAGAGDDAAEKGGRQRRPSLKAKAAGDPASLRAEQILAAGADAMALGEAGEKEKEKEKAK